MEPQRPQFGCFALPTNFFLSDVDSDGQPMRRRREHAKSRFGCMNCKERKVKCDENHPCGHCVKRKQPCSFKSSLKGIPRTSICSTTKAPASIVRSSQQIQKSISPRPSIPDQYSPQINLQHMQLFYHFETVTSKTFIMDPQAWKETVLALALQNEFLMHAVLLVTASHLQHLQPSETQHRRVVLEHLSQVLPSFRNALDTLPIGRGDSADALLACSMLILQYSWEFNLSAIQDASRHAEGFSSLLGLYSGLRYVIFEIIDARGGSRFDSMITYSPRLKIEQYFEGSNLPSEIKVFFGHCLTCLKISDNKDGNLSDYVDAARHLIPILCALKLGHRCLEASGLILDVARYLFAWPNLLSDNFIHLVKINDERSQVVLLYYFAAAFNIRSERFWWMRQRSVYMCEAILLRLGDRCEECMGWARELISRKEDIALRQSTLPAKEVDDDAISDFIRADGHRC